MLSTIGIGALVYGTFVASRKYRNLREGGLTQGGAIDSMVKSTGSEAAACVGAVCGAVCSATSALVGKLRGKPKEGPVDVDVEENDSNGANGSKRGVVDAEVVSD